MFWKKKRKMQEAVDSYVRAWLCTLTLNHGEVYHLGEFASVEFRKNMLHDGNLVIQGEFITSAAYEGLWVVGASASPRRLDGSGKLYLEENQGLRIYFSQEQFRMNKPIPIRSDVG